MLSILFLHSIVVLFSKPKTQRPENERNQIGSVKTLYIAKLGRIYRFINDIKVRLLFYLQVQY